MPLLRRAAFRLTPLRANFFLRITLVRRVLDAMGPPCMTRMAIKRVRLSQRNAGFRSFGC